MLGFSGASGPVAGDRRGPSTVAGASHARRGRAPTPRRRQPTPSTRRARRRRDRDAGPARGRRDRAGHPVPRRPRRDHPRRGRPTCSPGTSERYEALELVEDEADAILAALGVERAAGGRPARPRGRRGDPHQGPREAPEAAGVPARRRRRRRRSARWPGAAGRCSAWIASPRAGGLAADRAAAGRRPPTRPSIPARRGRCSPAATSCSTAASTRRSWSRARAPTSRSTAGRPRSPAATCCSGFGWELPRHAADRRTAARCATLIKGADLAHRQLREPGPGPIQLAHQRDGLLRRSRSSSTALVERRHRLRLARQQPHRRRRRCRDPADDREPRGARAGVLGRRQGPGRRAQAGDARGATASKVAVLGYDAIAKGYYAGEDDDRQRAAVRSSGRATTSRRARKAGADVVIVFPHWGTEYRRRRSPASSSSPATSSMPAPT